MIEIIGTIFIIIVGSLSHFVYDWFSHNKKVGYFVAVNESTWEHLKLVMFPTFLWLIIELHFYSNNSSLFFSRLVALITMLVIIPSAFYTYTKFTKKPILVVDISTFIVAIIIEQLVFSQLITISLLSNILFTHIGVIGLLIILLVYIMNTYVPRKNFLFKDPISDKYGIDGHTDSPNNEQ